MGVDGMERLTTRHCGVAVIKDKRKLKEAMEKLAVYEETEEKNIKTNGDVLRSMSDEQLAEFILKNCDNPLTENNEDMCDYCPAYSDNDKACAGEYCKNAIMSWLKEETECVDGCMGADSVAVLEECEKESDILEGQMEISDYPGIVPEEVAVNE